MIFIIILDFVFHAAGGTGNLKCLFPKTHLTEIKKAANLCQSLLLMHIQASADILANLSLLQRPLINPRYFLPGKYPPMQALHHSR